MQDVAGDGQLDLVELSGPSCADARDANDSSITNPANFRISASVRNGSRPVMASLATPCIMDHHASSVKVCGSLRGGAAPLGASEDFADHLVVGLPESAALWMGSPTLSHYLKTIAVPFGGNVCLLQ